MHELLSRLGNDDIIALIMVLTLAGVGLAMFITVQWRKLRQTEIDASLKHDMLNRGFSSREILNVLETLGANVLHQAPQGATETSKEDHIGLRSFVTGVESRVKAHVKQVLTRVAARL